MKADYEKLGEFMEKQDGEGLNMQRIRSMNYKERR